MLSILYNILIVSNLRFRLRQIIFLESQVTNYQALPKKEAGKTCFTKITWKIAIAKSFLLTFGHSF